MGLFLLNPSVVYRTALGREGNFEAVAYVGEKAGVTVLVLASHNQVAFNKAIPAFEKLVSSYQFYTEKVKLPKKAK